MGRVGVVEAMAGAERGRAVDAPVRWWGGAGWLVVAGAVLGALLWLWAASLPGSSLLLTVAVFWTWALAGLGWSALVVAGIGSLARGGRRMAWVLPALVAVVVVAGAAGLVALDAPLRVRWAASRPAFATVADQARPGVGLHDHAALATPGRLGAYRVSHAYQAGDAVVVVTKGGGGLMTEDGFAHLPDGPGPLQGSFLPQATFWPLGGGWYAFSNPF